MTGSGRIYPTVNPTHTLESDPALAGAAHVLTTPREGLYTLITSAFPKGLWWCSGTPWQQSSRRTPSRVAACEVPYWSLPRTPAPLLPPAPQTAAPLLPPSPPSLRPDCSRVEPSALG